MSQPDADQHHHDHHYAWWLIMCLCGVDYFSTLGYQPSIAFEGAGTLAPIATLILVLVTLLGALPVYRHVAGETPDGVGSIGMIERLFHGWWNKVVVLVLVGFAATDFVITKTLSAADAAAHLVSNSYYAAKVPAFMQSEMVVTCSLLVLLGAMFLKGFSEVVGLALVLVIAYLGLTAIVVGAGLFHLLTHPSLLHHWLTEISAGNYHLHHAPISGSGPWVVLGIACIVFPKLALGMSGFETGVLQIHLMEGTKDDPTNAAARIANTRKLLVSAALIMSVFLIASSLVTGTDTLIPADELRLEPVKGHDVLIRALGRLPADVCLAVIGDGSRREELARLVEQLGLSDRVRFAGHRDDVARLYPAFDVFCLPSRREGVPLAVIEAQASGVPVVATEVGSVRDALCPETARLVPSEDPAALAQALDAALASCGAVSPRAFVERSFDWDATVRRYTILAKG